jgi:hypothetical protein
MATQTVSVELPDEVLRRLQDMAAATRRSLADVLAQTIRGNLPPTPADLPPAQRGLMAELELLGDEALWAVAREELPPKDWRRHRRLLLKAEAEELTVAERRELDALREATDRFVMRRSIALALLKWRGHTIATVP